MRYHAIILFSFLFVSGRPKCILLVCKDSHGKFYQSQYCSKRQAAIFTKSWFKRLSRIPFKPQKHRKGMDKHTSVAEEPGDLVACLNMPSGLQNLEHILALEAKETTRMLRAAWGAFWLCTGGFGTQENEFLSTCELYDIFYSL